MNEPIEMRARGVVKGCAEGPALVADATLSFWGEVDAVTGKVIAVGHPLEGCSLRGCVLVIRSTKGSSATPMTLNLAKLEGNAPSGVRQHRSRQPCRAGLYRQPHPDGHGSRPRPVHRNPNRRPRRSERRRRLAAGDVPTAQPSGFPPLNFGRWKEPGTPCSGVSWLPCRSGTSRSSDRSGPSASDGMKMFPRRHMVVLRRPISTSELGFCRDFTHSRKFCSCSSGHTLLRRSRARRWRSTHSHPLLCQQHGGLQCRSRPCRSPLPVRLLALVRHMVTGETAQLEGSAAGSG